MRTKVLCEKCGAELSVRPKVVGDKLYHLVAPHTCGSVTSPLSMEETTPSDTGEVLPPGLKRFRREVLK